jgi:DNA-binding CsgD family transcriptional regulator
MQHCKRSSIPIAWDRDTYVRAGAPELWEEQAAFGYQAGVCTALHFDGGRHFVLGVDRDSVLPPDREELSRIAGMVQLLAVYANEALRRIRLKSARFAGLSAREIEALHWIAMGKTTWETSAILGIAERTVSKHLHGATVKLGAVDSHHAAILAWRAGLITQGDR